MNKRFLYVLSWPNGRKYIGQTINPQRRYRQHVGEISGGAIVVQREIDVQDGILPKMTVLAIFDLDFKYAHSSSYEQIVTQTAKAADWDLIYEDMGWHIDIEAMRENGRRVGRMKTPAMQKARKENAREMGRINTPERQKIRRETVKKIPREALIRGGRANTPAQRKARSENAHKINNTNSPATRRARIKNLKKIPRDILVENGRRNRKLTDVQIFEIRMRLNAGEAHTDIAHDFPVSRPSVTRINLGLTYAGVGIR